MIAERAVIAHGRRHHHGRAVEISVLQLARTLTGTGRQVHIDEGGLARGLGVAIGGRKHQGFRQQQNRLHAGHCQKGVEEPSFRAARIGEGILYLLGHQLMHEQLAARANHLFLSHARFLFPDIFFMVTECLYKTIITNICYLSRKHISIPSPL